MSFTVSAIRVYSEFVGVISVGRIKLRGMNTCMTELICASAVAGVIAALLAKYDNGSMGVTC